MLKLLRFHLHRAQDRMIHMANQKRSDRSFQVGEWVYVKLKPYRQFSVVNRPNQKLNSLYYGHYCILDKIGAVAYKLYLSQQVKVHQIFHVSKLKRALKAGQRAPSSFPNEILEQLQPEFIMDRKLEER